MKVMKVRAFIVSVMVMAAPGVLHAADLDLEKDFKREIALYRIRPDQAHSLKRDPDGTPVSEQQLKQAVQNFYDRLYPLDPIFLKRFQFRSVVFKDTIYNREGETLQRRKIGTDLYLDADLDEKQFYVNMFYLQVPLMPRTYLEHWNKLNPDGFAYESVRGKLSGNAQKKLDAVLAEWDKYFVSRTGMYSTEMDMAMTFAYVVEKGPAATVFVKENSPDVQKKIDLLVEILESVKAAERGYMQTLLTDDLSKLKTYVPYALAVRLEREYTGAWYVPGDDGETEEGWNEAVFPRKIGDPVKVAGRRVNPLILALETKNDRLFKVLMENKVDPNVANEKKVSALMLAIANNDPEQVKALLKAGAKVTQEASRAGTASGVNAEIVNLMKSYLPGVRQTNKPETKSPEKKSGAADARESVRDSLSKRLNDITFGHVEYEEIGVLLAVQATLQSNLKALKTDGEELRISLPPEYEKVPVTVVVDGVSLYELLQLIGKSAGLRLRVDETNRTLIFSPNPGQAEPAKKNGSAKKQQ